MEEQGKIAAPMMLLLVVVVLQNGDNDPYVRLTDKWMELWEMGERGLDDALLLLLVR